MKLKYLSWLPAVIIMGIIFLFSSKTADLSRESSLGISIALLDFYDNIKNVQFQEPEKINILAMIDHLVRKTAHFTEYGCLSAAIVFHFTVWKKSLRYKTWIPVVIAGLYAATDEYHQTFVSGRSGQVSDVLLDTAGAATGAFVFCMLIILVNRIRQRVKLKDRGKTV